MRNGEYSISAEINSQFAKDSVGFSRTQQPKKIVSSQNVYKKWNEIHCYLSRERAPVALIQMSQFDPQSHLRLIEIRVIVVDNDDDDRVSH